MFFNFDNYCGLLQSKQNLRAPRLVSVIAVCNVYCSEGKKLIKQNVTYSSHRAISKIIYWSIQAFFSQKDV